ncbi:MAG: T9SS type A sorting domain-containing protein [Candidatus Kapaibacterium sp.]
MKQLLLFITFLSVTLSARAEDFTVLWEIDIPWHTNIIQVSDDGKYFYYTNDDGLLKFHDSETGTFINQTNQENLILYSTGDYYLNNDRIVLPFSLDSILIYNIATKQTEETIDLNYDIENPNIYLISLSPNKRFLSLYCSLEDGNHIIIVDLNQKRLFRDVKISGTIGQLFNTNDPKRMIVTTSDQFGIQLVELTLDETAPLGYLKNMIEEVGKEEELNGLKYDGSNQIFYYNIFYTNNLGDILKYSLNTKEKFVIHKDDFRVGGNQIWFDNNYGIAISSIGAVFDFSKENSTIIKPFAGKSFSFSLCDGFETVLLREFITLQNHKLSRLDVIDFLTSVNTENPDNNILYPNPTTGNINISLANVYSSTFQYEIISTSGQIVQSAELGHLNINASSINLDISTLANGQYILRVFSEREEFVFKVNRN